MLNSVKNTTQTQYQQIEQRQSLVELIQAEIQAINKAAANILNADVLDKQESVAVIKQLIASMEQVLQVSDSEGSLFLRNTIRPVRSLYEKMLLLQANLLDENKKKITAPAIPEGMIPVFISLFQTEGLNLDKWTMLVRYLSRYIQGRPIYREEEHVLKLIRRKIENNSDAYVVVAIKPEMIVDSSRIDRNGCELLTLLDQAVQTQYIIEFVHQHKRYCLVENKLVLQD